MIKIFLSRNKMIASFCINVRFFIQMWLQTLFEFAIIYQAHMNQVLDFIFYNEIQCTNSSKHYNRCTSMSTPQFCKYFRIIAGFFWIYPVAVFASWIEIFLLYNYRVNCVVHYEKIDIKRHKR